MNTTSIINVRKLILINALILLLVSAVAVAGIWLPKRTGTSGSLAAASSASSASAAAINAYLGENPAETAQGLRSLQNLQSAFRSVAANVLPTIVEVDVVDIVQAPSAGSGTPFEFFFGPRGNQGQTPQFRQQGLGSGVIVRQDGSKVYVLTNNHVAGEAEEISIRLYDGRQFTAKLVGSDSKKDLALVSFESDEQLPVARLGDSDTLMVGDWVLAVGSPLGFESTVTSGIVSALGRQAASGSDVGSFTDYIQTDAAINQGNSGGALVNIFGEVVGLNTWIASSSGGNIGLGFAIPINNAKKAIDDFISKGRSEYGWLGISMGSLSLQSAQDLSLENAKGAFVYGVFKKSPADAAGVLPGDFVTSVNGAAVKDGSDLLKLVSNLEPGSRVEFAVIRNGQPLKLTARITVRDDESVASSSGALWPGFALAPMSGDIRAQLNLDANAGNLVIINVEQGSPAQIAGLSQGDVVRKLNGNEVKTLAEFYRAFNDTKSREVMLNITRQSTDLVIGLVR
jgi:Do/DeqQ family serine protease